MKDPLKTVVRKAIEARTGFSFQDSVVTLLKFRYGTDQVVPLRRVKDKGADCFLLPEVCVVACFGCEKYDKAEALRKIKDDYASYCENWKETHPNWKFVVNHSVSPDEFSAVSGKGGTILGLDDLVFIIGELTSGSMRSYLINHLNVEPLFLARDSVKDILDGILHYDESNGPLASTNYIKSPDLAEKIKVNFLQEEWQAACDEFEDLMPHFNLVSAIYKSYGDDEINIIKQRILLDFSNVRGNSFKEKINALTTDYKLKYAHDGDDEYGLYIRCVILYLFEQCLIGIPPPHHD